MSKYINQEWSRNIKPASKYPVIFAGRNTHIASVSVSGLSEPEIEAHCNLITAAPELLKSLKQLVERCNDPAITNILNEAGQAGLWACVTKEALEAINKAEGK